jgi:iron complex transport system ATP-binding protein
MPANKTIEIRSLTIGYPGRKETKVVAGNINADINNGELTCLLGANGMGKSTLLRTLSAFQPKLGGEIRVQGKAIETYTEKQLSRIIGVVLTDRPDIRNMTVEELIGLGRSPYTGFWGGLRKKDKKIIADAIALIKIEELAHRMVQTLSDGERQKVMIAKALVQETPVIFLDEPTAFLDFPSKVEIMQLLHQLSRETGKTIFLSTHDLELALQIADKLWIMDKKHGVTVGTPEDLSLNGSLDRSFARKGISFDMETGLFRVDNMLTKEIKLIGEGQEYAMARKALQRNGIKADPYIISDVYIEVKDNAPDYRYILYIPQEGIIRTASIESLLDAVKRFTELSD